MKTKEELNALRNEVKDLNAKLAELSEDELKEVSGGGQGSGSGLKREKCYCKQCGYVRDTFPEGEGTFLILPREMCRQCGAVDSFVIGDA